MNAVERLNLRLFIGMLGLLGLFNLLNQSAYATANIHCQTFFGDKKVSISESHVTFHKEKDGRGISSTDQVKTRVKFNGLEKVVYIDGNKHKLHIENLNKFSEASDYLAISNQEGHKVTYPLICQSL
jgi:hypothetical protein